jgi:transcriptional regulator with XRE-family HTH domain
LNVDVLEKHRKRKKMTAVDISLKLGKSKSWYSKIRKGDALLRTNYIVPLAELFGMNPKTLMQEVFFGQKVEDTSTRSDGIDKRSS